MQSKERIHAWSLFLYGIRRFFGQNHFLEVTTPYIVHAGAFEESLDCIQIQTTQDRKELHTSPEIEMKSLLAVTDAPIYQIAKCFRDDPPTPIHRQEFTMLEFYEPNATYYQTLSRTKELFQSLSSKPLFFQEITVENAFLNATGIRLNEARSTELLYEAISSKQIIHVSPDDTWDELYFKLLIEKVEPSFDPKIVTVLKDYPRSQAALAALSKNGEIAERFEFYWKGIELCNGCTELNDPIELEKRIKRQNFLRQQRQKPPHPIPLLLKEAVQKRKEASGVAVGLDRLFFCLTGFELV